ncbi:hypothetical protein JCM11251_000578 [Rhodosporidiobolus azoricus]
MHPGEPDVSMVTVKAVKEDKVVAAEVALVDEKGERRPWDDVKREVEEELLEGFPANFSRSSTFEARLTKSAWQLVRAGTVLYVKVDEGVVSPRSAQLSPSSSSLNLHRLATLGAPSMSGVSSGSPAHRDGEKRTGRSAPTTPYQSPAASPAGSRRTSVIEVSSDEAASANASFTTAHWSPASAARLPSRSRSSRPSSVVEQEDPFHYNKPAGVFRFKSLLAEFEDVGSKFSGESPPASRAPSRDGLPRLPHGMHDSRSASEESLATPAEGEPSPTSSSRSGSPARSRSALKDIEVALANVDLENRSRRTAESKAWKVKTCGNLNRGYSSSSPTHSRSASPARPALVTKNSTSSSTASSYANLPLHLARNERPSSPHPIALSSSSGKPSPPNLRADFCRHYLEQVFLTGQLTSDVAASEGIGHSGAMGGGDYLTAGEAITS